MSDIVVKVVMSSSISQGVKTKKHFLNNTLIILLIVLSLTIPIEIYFPPIMQRFIFSRNPQSFEGLAPTLPMYLGGSAGSLPTPVCRLVDEVGGST
jgi:hypothetical protein